MDIKKFLIELKESCKEYHALIIASSVFCVVMIAVFNLMFAESLELNAYNFRMQFGMKQALDDIVIVDLDDYSISKALPMKDIGLGPYPWPRTVYTKVMKYLNEAGAKAILVDINIEGARYPGKDEFSDFTFEKQLENIPGVFFIHLLTVNNTLFEKRIREILSIGKEQSLNLTDKNIQGVTKSLQKRLYQQGPGKLLSKHFNPNVDDTHLTDKKKLDQIQHYEMTHKQLDGIYKYAQGLGINRRFTDKDDVVRGDLPVYSYYGNYLLSAPLAIANYVTGNKNKIILYNDYFVFGDKKIPVNSDYLYYLNFRKPVITSNQILRTEKLPYPSLSFYTLYLNTDPNYIDIFAKEQNLNPEEFKLNSQKLFKDKIVIIAATAKAENDQAQIPNNTASFGVTILATAIDNLLNDDQFIKKASPLVNFLVTILLAFSGLLILVAFRFNKLSRLILFQSLLLIAVVYFALNIFIYVKYYFWLDLVSPLFTYIVITGGIIFTFAYIDKKKRTQLEFTFSKYVSPQVYNALLMDQSKVSLKATRENISVLFSDIRGFTSFSEEEYPEIVGKYLNEYFNEMVKVIFKHNGTVDKFMGDAIMAFFGAPVPDENHALNAAKAALEMKEALDKLNDRWIQQNRKIFDIGIGVNSGSALVGNFGSDELMDFTIIGDTVNLGSRLESLNKEEGTNILISAFTYQMIKDHVNVKIIGPKRVKGKADAVIVYELLGLK